MNVGPSPHTLHPHLKPIGRYVLSIHRGSTRLSDFETVALRLENVKSCRQPFRDSEPGELVRSPQRIGPRSSSA
jgi:hypothetical protein